jgi:glycosyltransferase involved in cell wall biosynthesis
MADHGIEVTVLAGPDDPGEGTCWDELGAGPAVVEVPVLRRAVDPVADARAAAWLAGWLRANRPRVVHTHSSKAGVLGRLAATAAGIPAAHTAHTVHGWSFAPQLGAGRGAGAKTVRLAKVNLERALARMTGALVVVTPLDRAQGLAVGIGRAHQYRLIRSGVDLSAPRRGRDRRAEIRAELGIAGCFAVGTVGRLVAQKNLGTLIDAYAMARTGIGPGRGRLVLVGDGPERAYLEARARAAGLGDDVLFCGHRCDAAELVAAFDVFALPSRWEGLPRALVEAVAAGVPVVATPVGGVAELVRHDQTGTLVPVADVAALAEAMRDHALRPGRYRCQAARAEAGIDGYSQERMRDDLAQLWFDLARS